ncbi:MAG: hypothetical protein R3B82_05275 [Sandaracinaceae bacterium]
MASFCARSSGLLLVLGALGCAPAPSQLVVVIDADLPPASLGVLRITVEEVGGVAMAERSTRIGCGEPGCERLPFSFGVAPPGDNPARAVRVRIEGAPDPGAASIVAHTIEVGFERGRVLRVPVHLSSACVDVACGEGGTCVDGVCVGTLRDRGRLLDARGDGVSGPIAPVRLVGPQQGATTGSAHAQAALRPWFHWAPVPGATRYELVADDSCERPHPYCAMGSPELVLEVPASDAPTVSVRPDVPLPVSTVAPVGARYVWRVRACDERACGMWSPARYLDVGRQTMDFDGDGYADLALGAPQQERPFGIEVPPGGLPDPDNPDYQWAYGGVVYVYPGSPSGLSEEPARRLTVPGARVVPEALYFGDALAAGDVDGDGFADLAVMASFDDQRATGVGAVEVTGVGRLYLYRGGPDGLTGPAALDSPVRDERWSADGWPQSPHFGTDVVITDVDGDGLRELIAGAPGADPDGVLDEGLIWIWSGSIELLRDGSSDMFAAELRRPVSLERAKWATIAPIGDLDGDGLPELHAQGWIFGGGRLDALSVRWNRPGGSLLRSAADVDADGLGELLIGRTEEDDRAGNVYVFDLVGGELGEPMRLPHPTPGRAGEGFGRFGGTVGDVNGDGYDDVVIASRMDDGPSYTGRAWLYLGGPGGLTSPPFEVLSPDPTLPRFAQRLSGVGDVDGDGFDDFVVRQAPTDDAFPNDEPSVFVYLGDANVEALTPAVWLRTPDGNRGRVAPRVTSEFGRIPRVYF